MMFRLLAGILIASVCAGCISTPTAGELKEAGTSVVDKASQAIGERMADPRLQESLRQANEKYGEEIRTAAKDLSTLAQSVSSLVAVARESPANMAEAITEREAVQTSLKNFSALTRSLERVVTVAQEGTTAFKSALADLQADLAKDDGVINQQRRAIVEDFDKERAAITETIRQERTATLKELDAITKKAIDQSSEKIKETVNGALIFLIVFVLVLLGLPFGAGLLVGRTMKKKP